MSQIFQWITPGYSDLEIMAWTNLTQEQIYEIRVEDANNLQVSAIHIPTGQRRTVSKERMKNIPWRYIETMLLVDFWEEPISWGDAPVYGKIWSRTLGRHEFVCFEICLYLQGGTVTASFQIALDDLNDPCYPPGFVYRDILDGLVYQIDKQLKTRLYGPRP